MAAARKIARKFARLPEKKLFCPTLGGCSPPAPSPGSYAYEHLRRLTLLSQVDLAVNVGLRGWGANSWTMDPSGLRPRARVVANLSNTGYICRQWVSEWVSEFGNGAVWVAIIRPYARLPSNNLSQTTFELWKPNESGGRQQLSGAPQATHAKSVDKHVRRELVCTPTLARINTDYDPGSVVSTAQSNKREFV